ncbi:unnamed protein product [Peniophora sp. CBMAI 1063]|nr:unnamed protein product [Peniophora sp. CBMAI 1063]
MSEQPSYPRSSLLVLAFNSVQALLPTTLIDKAEAYLDVHRIDDAVALADEQRKKLQAQLTVDSGEADALRYVHLRIGFKCLLETRFEDAGYHLFEGGLDPRLLISYYPDLRGSLLSEEDDVELFEGVADNVVPFDSVDDIISADLVRNYSPFLAPNTRSAPPTAELRRILTTAAYEMLESFLRKWRRVRGDGSVHETRVIVDTVLAKIFALNEKTTDLYALLGEQPDLILPELESVFISSGQYNALCSMYQARGLDEKLLNAWARIAEGEWTDPEIPDPLSNMLTLLTVRRNRALTQQWGVWLAAKDPERALKLLTSQGANRGRKASVDADLATLAQIRAANPRAAVQFLEHLVLQKRSSDPNLHTELAQSCISQVLDALSDEPTAKLWRAKAASYASHAQSNTPFLAYFASTTPDSPTKRARLRAALFLQSSSFYDALAIRERLLPHAQALPLEMSIVEGKLGMDHEALTRLAHTLRDSSSAEAYCTAGRRSLPPKIARMLAERESLAAWTLGTADAVPADYGRDAPKLLRMLLDVYIESGKEDAAAALMNSQAATFDVSDVLSRVPDAWPLPSVATFFSRALRRSLHEKHEALIVKGIAMGQNLAIADETHLILREQGYLVEEAIDDDDGDNEKALPPPPDTEEVLDEKAGIDIPRSNGYGQGTMAAASWDSAATPPDSGDHDFR